jgi:hypothetical protein
MRTSPVSSSRPFSTSIQKSCQTGDVCFPGASLYKEEFLHETLPSFKPTLYQVMVFHCCFEHHRHSLCHRKDQPVIIQFICDLKEEGVYSHR